MEEKLRILLIDDSELTLGALKAYLRSRFSIVTAPGASEALSLYSKTHLDLIVSDLPSESVGFELIAVLRERHPHTPIIAMTGWGRPKRADLKADLVLMKPFDLEELDEAIRVLMH